MNKFSLCFLSGPLTGTSFPLEKPEIILGSSDNCDISLQSEMISSSYMSLYVGAKKVTILIDSSGFLPILNNELVLQPTEVNSGDVLFLPDGSIGYFQSGSKELSVAIDIQQNTVSINGGQNQMLFAIPKFSPEYFCWYGFDKLNKENYTLAEKYFAEAQKYDPYYAQIYRGLFFTDFHITSENDILVWKDDIENNTNYQNFMNYSSMDEKSELLHRKQKILFEEQQALYDEATQIIQIATEPDDFKGAIERLNQIQDFRDSKRTLDYCQKERSIRNEQKKNWESNIRREQKKAEKKSSRLKLLLAISIILLIVGCVLTVRKISDNRDQAFIGTLLTANINQTDDITQQISENYDQNPNKYLNLIKQAFKKVYSTGNMEQCFFITNVCLLNESIRNDFSSFLDSDFRDFAVVFTSLNTINTFLDTYDYKNRKTTSDIAVVQIPTIILEKSTETCLDLISHGEFEKVLALIDFFEEKIDMTSVVKAVIRPMFIAQKINTSSGYYDDSSHKYKDSSKRDSIGWIVETTTTYYGDLACRKIRYYDTSPRWEGDPDYSWYYKGEYVSSSSCSQLNYVINKLTNYSFGPFEVKESGSNYTFENNQENKKFQIKF